MTAPRLEHPERFLVIGFCDAVMKTRGTADCTHFADEDRLECSHLPTKEVLRAYATELGLFPTNKRGSSVDICNPIYHVIGDGLEYVNCRTCFSEAGKMIDEMLAPQA